MLPAVPHPPVSKRPTIAIVGPGNLGSALASTLSAAGYRVTSIAVPSGRAVKREAKDLARRIGARLIESGKGPLAGDLVWIAVPDDKIAGVARLLARGGDWRGKVVFHSSGALSSNELAPLRAKGAHVASVHPMMTFVRNVVPEMANVAFALEGNRAALHLARSIVDDLGGHAFIINKQNKALYHVFGSFASPLVIALMATLEQVALAAGIRKRDIKRVMLPLLLQTLRNYLEHDAAMAFSGPLVRGDVVTIRKHLAALEKLPEARAVYVALAKAAAKQLPVRNPRGIELQLASPLQKT